MMEEAKIKAIRKYLSHNGVKYYDVQAELIDHFATAVEKVERERPELSFKWALLRAHRNFGGGEGFRKYLQSAEDNVSKKTLKLIGNTLLRFLAWPYLLLTAGIVGLWYFLLKIFAHTEAFWDIIAVTLFAGFLLLMLINHLRLRKVQMYLPRQANRNLGWIAYFLFYIPFLNPMIMHGDGHLPFTYAWIYFSFVTLVMIAFVRVPDLAVEETKKMYPKISG